MFQNQNRNELRVIATLLLLFEESVFYLSSFDFCEATNEQRYEPSSRFDVRYESLHKSFGDFDLFS